MPAFEELRSEMEADDGTREVVIKRSRDVLKLSKTAIYCLHRGQTELATSNLAEARTIVEAELFPLAEGKAQLRFGGALSGALEEYAEAVIFQGYLQDGRVPSPRSEGLAGVVNRDEYLGGVMDFVGEVTRTAVLAATRRDEEAVARAREAVDDVQLALMGFDFRNGQLRRKYDGIKYSLKKLEQVTYEMSLTEALGQFSMGSREVPSGDGDNDDAADGEDGQDGSAASSGGRGGRRGGRGGGRGSGRGGGRGGGSRSDARPAKRSKPAVADE